MSICSLGPAAQLHKSILLRAEQTFVSTLTERHVRSSNLRRVIRTVTVHEMDRRPGPKLAQHLKIWSVCQQLGWAGPEGRERGEEQTLLFVWQDELGWACRHQPALHPPYALQRTTCTVAVLAVGPRGVDQPDQTGDQRVDCEVILCGCDSSQLSGVAYHSPQINTHIFFLRK